MVGATGSRRSQPLEVREELAPIAEARQGVCGRLVSRQLEEPAVLAEGPDQSHDDEEQSRGRERDGQDVHGPEVVVHEDPGRDHRTHGRHGEEWAPLDLQSFARVVRQPRRRCDEQHRGRPQHVDPRARHVGARRPTGRGTRRRRSRRRAFPARARASGTPVSSRSGRRRRRRRTAGVRPRADRRRSSRSWTTIPLWSRGRARRSPPRRAPQRPVPP